MAALVNKKLRSFRVMYRIKETDALVTIGIKTESLRLLHKVLCGMTRKVVPMTEWAEMVAHETLDNGTVLEHTGKVLGLQFDDDLVFAADTLKPETPINKKALTHITLVRKLIPRKRKNITEGDYYVLG